MKIGFISTHTNSIPPSGYGGEVYYANLVKGLAAKGHEIHLFATGGSMTPEGGKLWLTPSRMNGDIDRTIEPWIVRTYKDLLLSMDVVHDCSLDHLVAQHLRNFYDYRPIINTINGTTYNIPKPPFNVVTGSKFWQDDALKHGLATEMIYWGSDTEFYTPDYEKEDYFLWIARFHPHKGLDVALNLAKYMGFKLKVAGSMQFEDHARFGAEYMKAIETIPNVEYVKLPMDDTHHEAKRKLMQKAKAFLYPVRYRECFGMVVTEAMACGTPVITSDCGAMPEIVDHGVNGFICKDETEMVKAINDFKKYEENKPYHSGFDMWKAAREKAEKFDPKYAVDQYDKLYARVAGGYAW